MTGIGSIFLLNELQEADGNSGGGRALLGSVVQENESIFHTDYPVPMSIYELRIVLTELNARRQALGITGDTVLRTAIAAGQRTYKVKRSDSFQVGLGGFPGIPFSMKFQIDYTRTKSIMIDYGQGTVYEYIPKGYLSMMYRALDGRPTDRMGGEFLDDNAFISMIQISRNWSVQFESTEDFRQEISGRISAFNNDELISGKVVLRRETARTLKAEVRGTVDYMVALMSTRWDDINPD